MRSVRARSQISGSNGDSSARAVIRRGIRAPGKIRRVAPAPDGDALQPALLEELRDRPLRVRRPEPVVVTQVRLRGHPQRTRRP